MSVAGIPWLDFGVLGLVLVPLALSVSSLGSSGPGNAARLAQAPVRYGCVVGELKSIGGMGCCEAVDEVDMMERSGGGSEGRSSSSTVVSSVLPPSWGVKVCFVS